MKYEQLSFLEQSEVQKLRDKRAFIEYDATICSRCCCNRCKYSVEITPCLSQGECKEIGENSCFNCDECYYFGMDNQNLSRNKVKLKCDKFEISNYYAELEAKRRRKNYKII